MIKCLICIDVITTLSKTRRNHSALHQWTDPGLDIWYVHATLEGSPLEGQGLVCSGQMHCVLFPCWFGHWTCPLFLLCWAELGWQRVGVTAWGAVNKSLHFSSSFSSMLSVILTAPGLWQPGILLQPCTVSQQGQKPPSYQCKWKLSSRDAVVFPPCSQIMLFFSVTINGLS